MPDHTARHKPQENGLFPMRLRLFAAISAMALFQTTSVQARLETPSQDLNHFQGSWALVSGERDGVKLAEAETAKTLIHFDGKNFDFPASSEIGTSQSGTIKLDTTKNPKWIDSISTSNGANAPVSLGIYEFTETGYRVCFAPPGKPRPMEFSSKAGTGHDLQSWKSADNTILNGTYTMVSGELNGEKITDDILKSTSLKMDGNKHFGKVGDSSITGTHKLNPNKSPKEIDSTHVEGPLKGQSYLGIYKIENDVWTVCFAPPGKPRPRDFSTKAGSDVFVHVWKKK